LVFARCLNATNWPDAEQHGVTLDCNMLPNMMVSGYLDTCTLAQRTWRWSPV